jgi:hypothetical protein
MDLRVEDHFWDASHMDHGDLAWLGGPRGATDPPMGVPQAQLSPHVISCRKISQGTSGTCY